eukprot:GFUD01068480.1.p1 GENE.GFUD01068480.1~~GFUD01068480.1.p1  ORF type:complete len:214 (-),score=39.29 GFUD01068480.1:11-652(-)
MAILNLFTLVLLVEIVFRGQSEASPTRSGDSCDSLVVDKNTWTGNLEGKLKIKLASHLSSYTITFETDVPLSSITFWEGDISPASGSSFTLTNKDWFSGEKTGAYLELGFQMRFSGYIEPSMTGITLNGVDACSGELQGPAPLPVPASAPGPSTTYGQLDCLDGATQETGEECCCGSCYPSIVSLCQDGVWIILYFTDACLSPSCGGRQLITS